MLAALDWNSRFIVVSEWLSLVVRGSQMRTSAGLNEVESGEKPSVERPTTTAASLPQHSRT